jgi:hypothetical protein
VEVELTTKASYSEYRWKWKERLTGAIPTEPRDTMGGIFIAGRLYWFFHFQIHVVPTERII